MWIGMLIRTFFGWWGEENALTPPNEVWFIEQIEQLSETWDVSWKQENIDEILLEGPLEIRVMMPSYFYNLWWKKFAQDLFKESNVYMNFKFIDNLSEYRDKIYSPDFKWADVVLIPYDWANEVDLKTFTFQSNLWSTLDSMISNMINIGDKSNFLPFSLDPMIMYVASWNMVPKSFNDLSEYVYGYSSSKPMSMPLWFWIVSEDYNEWFMREYQDIVRYALIHYFVTYRDIKSFQKWIDANVFEWYNIRNIQSVVDAISDPKCKDFPSICLQLYNFVWVRFWFLSDSDVVNQYFSKKKTNFNEKIKLVVPFFSIESPVRLRWWSILNSVSDAKTLSWIYLFFIKYKNDYSKYGLRNSTLSVFAWSWNESLLDNQRIGSRWYILSEWWNYIEQLRSKRFFWQLIEYQISAKDYLLKS